MEATTFEQVAQALSDGLDLCIRARRMDAQQRTNDLVSVAPSLDLERYAPRHNAINPDQPVFTRSATMAVWAQDQYDRDLAEWERKSRELLMRLPADPK